MALRWDILLAGKMGVEMGDEMVALKDALLVVCSVLQLGCRLAGDSVLTTAEKTVYLKDAYVVA